MPHFKQVRIAFGTAYLCSRHKRKRIFVKKEHTKNIVEYTALITTKFGTNSLIDQNHENLLTLEHSMNYVPVPFMEEAMFKTVIQEAAALASLSLFVSMIFIWSQVLGSL